MRAASLLSPAHSEAGFTLLEVLVAVVVLSFGLLGLVGLQAVSLQANREARTQAQAANMARELAEMIRGNKATGVQTSSSTNPYLGTFAVGALSMGSNASYCSRVANASTGCSSALDAGRAEMTDWLARVNNELPGARVTVCFDASPFDSNGLPQWSCTPTGADEILMIKIGWTRASTDRSQTGSAALELASDSNSRPYIVIPVTAGNATSGV